MAEICLRKAQKTAETRSNLCYVESTRYRRWLILVSTMTDPTSQLRPAMTYTVQNKEWVCLTQFPLASHGCHQEERRALLGIKSSLEDPTNRLYSWQQGNKYQNCCDWLGIQCSGDSLHVISINLRNTEYEIYYNEYIYRVNLNDFNPQTLHYKLSSTKWLTGLVNFEVLRLSRINLHEATSSENNFLEHISFLSDLKVLDLSYCNISGPVFPIQEYTNFSRLSSLNMSFNPELNSSFPEHLAKMTSLSSLYLTRCNLHGSVPYMPQLEELDVGNNTALHVDLAQMFERKWPKLKSLRISTTKVTGQFFDLISNVPMLEFLKASGCSIQGSIPKSICKLSSLREIFLQRNNFTGTMPSCITMLRYLDRLDISKNFIRGDVSLSSLFTKLNLSYLKMGPNKLTVSIHQDLHLYPKLKLKVLGLASCNLKGLFPDFICNLTDLENLQLSGNNLTGTIPSCMNKLKNLMSLDFSSNNFHGPLPLPCKNAKLYNLANNKLNGEISMEVGERLSTVSLVWLSGNELKGSIPFSVCSKEPGESNIQYLDLSNNNLSGIIPTSVGYCHSLIYLNLGINNLTGNVPKELEQAKKLQILQLNDNNFDGDPLNFIGELHELVVLDLGNNNFGGSISSLAGSLGNLQILSLRTNNFNESIPKEILDLQQLHVLDLSRNNLTGIIPNGIGNLQLQMTTKGIITQYENLYTYNSGIDLSSNKLEGEIPEEIGRLKGLSMLNLSHNHLSGNIPLSVGSMNGLESLDLSFNKLSGPIPVSLASMDFLGYLNLSYNNLSGTIPRGPHFDTLSGDGSAYVNNSFLCGYLTKSICGDDSDNGSTNYPSEVNRDEEDESKDKWYLFGVVVLGFIVGFWGLFFGLVLKKEKWWCPYWKFVDSIAVRTIQVFLRH
ncbi:probable leucine-rich repeat receptor-like protein kinase At1g35710 [Papaver somniferum]|uniref:probable leucine-rich repeat receptor-like protein kinase At1g35710 n=1 Tax=Papaver somniferum TaxID=3469 RepID=UPI000E6FAC4C|nr:probable leucine-rich repeat receptor-like protein kinase At1g35710 [Papaver somniferum]